MKKTVYALLTFIIITFLMFLYIESNFYKGIVEVCLNDYYTVEETIEALEQGKIYDYLIIYDLYNEENTKVYKGNINILLRGKIKEKINIEFSEDEVLMGDKFAGKNYEYYPLGREHKFNNKEYRINAIIIDSSDMYYNDLSMLENQNIKRQRIYAVLKDKDGVKVDENTFLSILKSRNINPTAHIYYENIGKLLLKIIILCFTVILLCILFKFKDGLKKLLSSLIKGYKDSKYDIDILSYIKKHESTKIIKSITLSFSAMIVSIILIMFLSVKYINLRMPYKFNPVSPKGIYGVLKSFCDFILYYLNNGLTEMSLIVFKIICTYFMVIFLSLIIYITRKHYQGES